MDRYEALKQKVIDRKYPFDRFIVLLEGETTWLISPRVRDTIWLG